LVADAELHSALSFAADSDVVAIQGIQGTGIRADGDQACHNRIVPLAIQAIEVADPIALLRAANNRNSAVTLDHGNGALPVALEGVPVFSISGRDQGTKIALLKGRCGPPKT